MEKDQGVTSLFSIQQIYKCRGPMVSDPSLPRSQLSCSWSIILYVNTLSLFFPHVSLLALPAPERKTLQARGRCEKLQEWVRCASAISKQCTPFAEELRRTKECQCLAVFWTKMTWLSLRDYTGPLDHIDAGCISAHMGACSPHTQLKCITHHEDFLLQRFVFFF